MSITTIKVTTDLRERVRQHARRGGLSQADVLQRALDLLDRDVFFQQLRSDVAAHPESESERTESDAWLGGPLVSGEQW